MQNTAFLQKAADYYTRFKWWMLPFIKDAPNVIMDLGCASGRMGQRLLELGKAEQMFGVELFENAALEASKIYKKVHVGDIEVLQLDYEGCFDYVICGDILEHLKDPCTVTRKIFEWLKPGGTILVCLPNVRNYRVLIDLVVFGEWKYASAGILDQTHFRFFTSRSCNRMLKEAGFQIVHKQMIVEGPRKQFLNKLTFGLFDEFLAAQVFFAGRKNSSAPL